MTYKCITEEFIICSTVGIGPPVTEALQSVRASQWIFHAKRSEESPTYFPHKLKHHDRAGDWLILTEASKRLLRMTNTSCNRTMQVINQLNAESDSDHCAYHQSVEYHVMVCSKLLWGKRLGLDLLELSAEPKLQALVYDILPSTTAVFTYAIGSRKLSANEQFFVGSQTVVSLLQTTQVKQGLSFIAANKVYTSTNKTTIIWIETKLFLFLPRVDTSHVYVGALTLCFFYSHIGPWTFWRALTVLLDSCVEIKSTPSVA